MNRKIVESAIRAANGKITTFPHAPGWCLSFVRAVVEDAIWGGQRGPFYDRYLVAGTSKRGNTPQERLREARQDPWASDLEASMKALGMAVPAFTRRPGDLVFNHNAAAPVGHVGVLLTKTLVIENIRPSYRPQSIILQHGSLAITPYDSQPWTLVARLR